MSECTVSNQVHFPACWHAWFPPRPGRVTFFYPDVKLTHANYQLSRNTAPRLMTIVLYNLMRSSEGSIDRQEGRSIDPSELPCTSELQRNPQFPAQKQNAPPLPPLKYKCLQCPRSFLSWCWAADTFWFLSATGRPALTRQNLFSPLGFSSMYSTVLGVHHPVHSQLPQWGHFFRNTLQASIALGITKSRTVILDLLLQGNSVLSQPSELFICDQHWLKWL